MKDYIDEKFGLVEVIGPTYRRRREMVKIDYRYYVFGECDCGKIREFSIQNLISGHTKSCGCNRIRRNENNPNYKGFRDISGDHWWTITYIAKKRNLTLEISIDEAWEIFEKQKGLCALTGKQITLVDSTRTKRDGSGSHRTASLDRINSSLGYTKKNCQWVHKDINQIKSDLSEDWFKYLCKQISNNNKKIS